MQHVHTHVHVHLRIIHLQHAHIGTATLLLAGDGLDNMYAGVVRSVNVELLQRQLQEPPDRRTMAGGLAWALPPLVAQDGAIVSMTPLGSSPGGEVYYVSSEDLAAAVASKLQAIKLVYITRGQCLVDTRQSRIIAGPCPSLSARVFLTLI